MSRIAGIITVLSLCLPAGSAAAQGFSTSFPSAVLDTYHRTKEAAIDSGIMVAGAGEPGELLADATAALRESYGRLAPLVMDEQSLGSINDLGDADIVKKAKHLPVSHVAIVRVFAGGQAVVVVYDKWGKAVATFSVRVGARLRAYSKRAGPALPPPRAVPRPVVPGPTTPLKTVSAAQPAARTAATDPRHTQYLASYIWFSPGSVRKGKLLDWNQDSTAFVGNKRKKLSGKSFYLKAGRKDLATKYSSRNKVRWAFILGGIGVTAGGAGIAFGLREDCSAFVDNTPDRIDCDDGNGRKLMAGGIVAGTGFLAWLVGWYLINPHPVSAKEAQSLADKHNASLRGKLGLPAGYNPPPPPAPAPKKADKKKTSWRLDPMFGTSGGGLVVTGRF